MAQSAQPSPRLAGTETERNLRTALARESEASRRYLWYASQADIDGRPEVASLFRQLAERETGHAFGHLELIAELAESETSTVDLLRSALDGERHDATVMYPEFARTARAEGFEDVGTWMESLADAEADQAERLATELARLEGPDPDRATGSTAAADDRGAPR